jgi:hypothetical protein
MQESEAKIQKLIEQKLEIAAKIRELRAEAGKLNLELGIAGANPSIIASW